MKALQDTCLSLMKISKFKSIPTQEMPLRKYGLEKTDWGIIETGWMCLTKQGKENFLKWT